MENSFLNTPVEALEHFNVSEQTGLSQDAVSQSRDRYGPNALVTCRLTCNLRTGLTETSLALAEEPWRITALHQGPQMRPWIRVGEPNYGEELSPTRRRQAVALLDWPFFAREFRPLFIDSMILIISTSPLTIIFPFPTITLFATAVCRAKWSSDMCLVCS